MKTLVAKFAVVCVLSFAFLFVVKDAVHLGAKVSAPTISNPTSDKVITSTPAAADAAVNVSAVGSNNWINDEIKVITTKATNLNPKVLKLSLKAYLNAHKEGLDPKELLTVVDYTKPSNHRRLWVIDLKNDKVLFNTWVTHGRNSGQLLATSFSNQFDSLKSSLGLFLTSSTYTGNDGYSLHIKGLEKGINNNAYDRRVVVHGAWYASGSFAKERGELGRSWGCFAVGESIARPLINTIKDNTLIFAYYPEKKWLDHSAFLNESVSV